MAMAPSDELRHSSSAWLDHHNLHHHHHNTQQRQQNSQFFINLFETNAGDTNRSRCVSMTAAAQQQAAAAAAVAAAAMRREWRWRWRLRRQRYGKATVVDKISTEYDITQQQRTRSCRRERGSAGSLAPTPEVARTRHASPATL